MTKIESSSHVKQITPFKETSLKEIGLTIFV